MKDALKAAAELVIALDVCSDHRRPACERIAAGMPFDLRHLADLTEALRESAQEGNSGKVAAFESACNRIANAVDVDFDELNDLVADVKASAKERQGWYDSTDAMLTALDDLGHESMDADSAGDKPKDAGDLVRRAIESEREAIVEIGNLFGLENASLDDVINAVAALVAA